MTRRFLPGLLAFACVSSGCLHSATTIEVRPDGSGTILQETAMSSETLDLLKTMGSAKPGEPKPEFFTEAAARKLAATMGATFISGEPFRKANLGGYRARFAFDDISNVRLNLDVSGSPFTEAELKDPLFDFSLERGPTSSLLTIQVPQGKPGDFGLPLFEGGTGALESADKAEAAQAMAMAKKMMNGLFIDVSLNVNGRILKSDAPYVQGTRITLMQIDFEKLLAAGTSFQKLQAAPDTKSLSGVPGVKMVSEPTITIEFNR